MEKKMKRKTLPILIIIVLIVCVPMVDARLEDTTPTNTPTPEPTLTPPPEPTRVPTAIPTPGQTIVPTPGQTSTGTTTNSITGSKISGLSSSTVLSISLANLDPNPAVSGDVVEVRIGVENMGGDTTSDVMMEIVPEYPFELVPGENTIKKVGTVEGYEADSTANIKIIKYKMKINKDALAGIYEIKVKYYETGSNDKTTKSLYIDVKSRANAEIIHIDKTALVPGKQNSLKFTINNVGNAPLRDVTFNWEDKDSIILPVGSDNTRYIKYIDVNDGFDLVYQVIADTGASPGLYKLNIYLNYRDGINGTTKQLSSIAGVYVGGGTDFDISFSEGTNSETSFSVANIGSNPAYAVLVLIPDQKDLIVSGSDSVMIGNLNSGDYTSASFKLQSSINTTSQNTISQNITSRNNQRYVKMQISYTDTMGERKIVEKEVKLALQNIVTTNDKIANQDKQGNPIHIFIGILLIFLAFGAYRKYKKQKLVDPNSKIIDLLKGKKKRYG